MAFFDNFKLIRKQKSYSITYKKRSFINVKGEVLGVIIRDYATKKFLKDLSGLNKDSNIDTELLSRAMVLGKAYIDRKKKFFRNKKLNTIDPKSKEFQSIIKASKIMDKHRVAPKFYIDAQVDGLKFLNDGQGGFPTVSQLCTSGAEDRLVKAMYENGLNDEEQEVVKIKLSRDDKETPLMENPTFIEYYESIEQNTASLREAYYVHDCMLARKGRVTTLITDYINSKEGNE